MLNSHKLLIKCDLENIYEFGQGLAINHFKHELLPADPAISFYYFKKSRERCDKIEAVQRILNNEPQIKFCFADKSSISKITED